MSIMNKHLVQRGIKQLSVLSNSITHIFINFYGCYILLNCYVNLSYYKIAYKLQDFEI